jgi:hypothetical protein
VTLEIKHKFQSAKVDGLDTTEVRPSNWNDTHAITMATARVLGRATASAGAAEELDLTNATQRNAVGLGALANKSTVATADIDDDAVTYAKMQNVSATNRLLGRVSSGAGNTEEITIDTDTLEVSGTTLRARLNLPRGYLDGFQMSNAVADANNDITIQKGYARDDGNAGDINLTSVITKRLDASWAVGTDQGGLDTGARGNSTWYHVWAIARPDTGVSDVLFSLSATAPTMPANYTLKHRIGSILTNASGNIVGFVQRGDYFYWKNATGFDLTVTASRTTAVLETITVPTGIEVIALLTVHVAAVGKGRAALVTSPNVDDTAVSTTNCTVICPLDDSYVANDVDVLTNNVAQVRLRTNNSTMTTTIRPRGWIDPRGADAA